MFVNVKRSLFGGASYNCRRHEAAWSGSWDISDLSDSDSGDGAALSLLILLLLLLFGILVGYLFVL